MLPAGSSLWRLPGIRSQAYLCGLAFLSFFLTLSALPLYAISIGTGTGAAGVVTTVMLATTVGTQTLVPALVNRFGLVPVLAAGLLLLGAPAPLYLLGKQFAAVLIISGVRGMGFAVITVLMPLVAGRLVAAPRRGEAIGFYGLAIAVPNLIGVPLGVALTAAGSFGWVACAAASPVLALPLLRPIARSLAPIDARGASAGKAVGAAADAPARSGSALRAIAGVTVVLFVVTFAGGGVFTFLPVAASSGALATVGLLVFGVTGALARWRAGSLADRRGSRTMLPVAVLLAAGGVGLLGFGLAGAPAVVVLIAAAVLGLGYGAVQNLSLLAAFDRAGPRHQAVVSAAWNAAYDAGTAAGAVLVGLLAASGRTGGTGVGAGVGFSWSFGACAVLIVLTLPLALRAGRRLS